MSDRKDALDPRRAAQSTEFSGADPYALQRARRDRLRAALRHGRLAVIDIGAFKICCAVVEFDQNGREPRILGAAQLRSRGVRAGAIVDMSEAEQAVRAVVAQAERAAGVRVYYGMATLTGGFPRSLGAAAEITLDDNGRIGAEDVDRALRSCRAPAVTPADDAEARTMLHATPAAWSIDGEQGLRDPRGLSGRRLGVDLHILTVAESAVRNVAAAMARADLEPVGVVSTAYASGLSCLSRDEQEHGAACIDLGGGASAVSMFLRGRLVFADLVRLGGEHVTLDISRGLGFGFDEAERLKILEGSALAPGSLGQQMLPTPGRHAPRGIHGGPHGGLHGAPHGSPHMLVERYGERRGPTRSDLVAVIRPRVEEVLELARDRLEQAGFAYLPNRSAVLCGGAAQLPGVQETAQKVLGRQVRIGRPRPLPGLTPEFAGPSFAALTGLIAYANREPDEIWDLVRAEAPQTGGLGARLWRWLRESW